MYILAATQNTNVLHRRLTVRMFIPFSSFFLAPESPDAGSSSDDLAVSFDSDTARASALITSIPAGNSLPDGRHYQFPHFARMPPCQLRSSPEPLAAWEEE
jgi:hypothetical protein